MTLCPYASQFMVFGEARNFASRWSPWMPT